MYIFIYYDIYPELFYIVLPNRDTGMINEITFCNVFHLCFILKKLILIRVFFLIECTIIVMKKDSVIAVKCRGLLLVVETT